MPNRITLLLGALLFLTSGTMHATTTVEELPELGDSSSNTLSQQRAALIGSEIVRSIRQAGLIIDDPLLSAYVEKLGNNIAAHTSGGERFTFFVVDAPSINAFALPGGYIGIHSGLILASQSESELAGVVAHEIAHVTQHHIARGIEQANRMDLPLTLAVLATILLSGGDPGVANAAVAAGLGGSTQMQINFTRAHEHEADRIGIQLLARTEYETEGMAAFFKRLQENSRYYGEGVPEFLSTHPVTTSRLAEAQVAAEQYQRRMRLDSSSYHVAKARVKLMHSKSAEQLMRELTRSERRDEHSLYLQAITHIALQQPQQAKKILSQLLRNAPESIPYRETYGRLLFEQGEHTRAIKLYRDGLKRYPNNELLLMSLCRSLLAEKNYSEGRDLLQGVVRRNPRSIVGIDLLAQLETETGNPVAAHLARAEYYLLLEEPHSALGQVNLAKRVEKKDFYHSSRIEALTQQITEQIANQAQLQQE
ncbi:MAG: M48 family metalloprotease [Chromatiales bacterium]|nr:M48 family metalloprotease [Chromatiales bacterium]